MEGEYMAPSKQSDPAKTSQPNEGEGNRTAARKFDEDERRFVKSGKVEEKAREAAKALDGDERKELERAEAEGKRHIAGGDPKAKR
jgi:hypothetical protein